MSPHGDCTTRIDERTSQVAERRPGQILERHNLAEDSTRQAGWFLSQLDSPIIYSLQSQGGHGRITWVSCEDSFPSVASVPHSSWPWSQSCWTGPSFSCDITHAKSFLSQSTISGFLPPCVYLWVMCVVIFLTQKLRWKNVEIYP